jgi:hypothetical protein
MCVLILDALFILGIVSVLNDGDEPEFFKAFLAGLGISVVTFALVYGLAQIAPLAVLLAIPLIAVVSGLVLWLVFEVAPVKAIIGGVAYLFYKIAIQIAFMFMLSGLRG